MRGHHLHKLPAPLRSTLYLVIALILFAVLTPFMFGFGLITGISFLVSCAMALWSGVLRKDAGAVMLIAVGYWITNLAAHLLLPGSYSDLKNQSLLNAALLALVFIFIWWRVRHLKDGKRRI